MKRFGKFNLPFRQKCISMNELKSQIKNLSALCRNKMCYNDCLRFVRYASEDPDQCDQIGQFIGLWATF